MVRRDLPERSSKAIVGDLLKLLSSRGHMNKSILELTKQYVQQIRQKCQQEGVLVRIQADELEGLLNQWLSKYRYVEAEETRSRINEDEMFMVNLVTPNKKNPFVPDSHFNKLSGASEKNKEDRPSSNSIGTDDQKLKSGRPTKFPKVERRICHWIKKMHESGNSSILTQNNIIRKAIELQKELYPDQTFTGSKGWFERFGHRNPSYFRLTMKHGKPRYLNIRKKIKKQNDQSELEKTTKVSGEIKMEDFHDSLGERLRQRLQFIKDDIFMDEEETERKIEEMRNVA